MYPASSDGLNKETDETIYFFTPAFHPLDNFSAHRISLWGHGFPTAEHAFQWKKFAVTAPAVAEQILKASSPHQVKQIADHASDSRPADWHDQRVAVMREILTAKSAQHADVREFSRGLGSAPLSKIRRLMRFGESAQRARERILSGGSGWKSVIKLRESKPLRFVF